MMRRCLLALLPLFWLSCSNETPKKESPNKEMTNDKPVTIAPVIPPFDGQRAFEYLKAQVAFGPRTAASAGHRECLDYLRMHMEQYADSVILQPFTVRGYEGEDLRFTNIIASFNRRAATRILLLAHWDTRPRADQDKVPAMRDKPILGANDGASGVAVLMEIARHLKARPPAVGVDILFDDAEDYGKEGDTQNYLLGTRHFARNMPPGPRPAFGILLHMVGDKDLDLQKEAYSMRYAPDLVALVWSAAREVGAYQFTENIQRAVLDDHLPLNEVGLKTIDLIDFNYPDASNRYWHTTEDTPDKCSAESLEAVGKVLMYVAYRQPV